MTKTDSDYVRAYKFLQQTFLKMWNDYAAEAAEKVMNPGEESLAELSSIVELTTKMKMMREIVVLTDGALIRAIEGEI